MSRIERLVLALRVLVGRGVQRSFDYENGVPVVETQYRAQGGTRESELVEPFGYASHAPDGSEHITLSLGGNRSQTIVIAAHNRSFKFELNMGEVAIYNQFGDHVHLKDNGEAHVKASAKVYAETPLFECSADCIVRGNLTVDGTSQLKQTTTIEAGSFICAAQSVFSANAGFTAGITNNGTNIGASHDHSAGNEPDGSTGPVR